MRIPENIIEQVRNDADILNIVQDYVRMKKAGNNYVGLCPFHDEKTASFNVSPSKGFFKCFGCGKGGNVITFVMEVERLDFADAVRWLADRMGIEIPVRVVDQEAFAEKEIVYNALRFAAEHYAQRLEEPASGSGAREYLDMRGLTPKTIERFKLGYAPNSWDGLLKAAERKHIKAETLVRAGLVVKRDDGKGYYDRFRNRIMFPVWSHVGKIIGFGGRVLVETPKTPKYLNSPETEVYHKSYVLYGLFQAKREARQQDRILLVEGYTDVLALDQAGVSSVACCGTALTPQQVNLLGRYVKEVQLLYDADSAGATATERAIDCVLQNGLDTSVVLLPEGEDPDSFARNQGTDKFKAYLKDSTKDWMDSFYSVAAKENLLSTPRGKRQELSKIAKRLSWLQDSLLRKLYIQKASQLFGIQQGDIAREVNTYYRDRQKPAETASSQSADTSVVDMIPEAEKMLLQLMFQGGAPMIKYILDRMSLVEFQEGPSRELAEALADLYHEYGEKSEINSLTSVDDGMLQVSALAQQLVAGLMVSRYEVSRGWRGKKIAVPEMNEDPTRVAQDCMRRIKRKLIKKQIKELQEQVLSSESGSKAQLKLQDEYRETRQKLLDVEKLDYFDKSDDDNKV